MLLLATQGQQIIYTKITILKRTSTTVSNKAAAKHQRDIDTDSDKIDKYAKVTDDSTTKIHQ